jgi:glutathionyl-hydroquinone reductase
MGMLIEGIWKHVPRDTKSTGGAFVRPESAFRSRLSRPEAGRYRLYVSKSCPWAHRTLIVRALKGLDKAIPVSYADPDMGEEGWRFPEGYLHRIYVKAEPRYTGRVTVPVLWDAREGRIVNNESSEIIRMLNRDFERLARRKLGDLYPAKHKKEIDWLNERIYRTVNNGVYRAGFATAQDKYEQAVTELFRTLDWLEKRMKEKKAGKWLCGATFTEADVRLFTTLVRFDAVYYSHFKCNLRRLVDYPNLWRWTRRVYALPGVKATTDFREIKRHYYHSMKQINPTQIVPKGPLLDFSLR